MELKFDEMKVDTKLAKDYLRNIKDFQSFGPSNYQILKSLSSWETNNYKVTYTTNLEIENDICKNEKGPPENIHARSLKLKALALKVQKNADLFAQLENLLRNKPLDDTYLQIEILIKQLKCANYNNSTEKIFSMASETPILGLGYIATVKPDCYSVIIATVATAAISYLFVKLCHEVGLSSTYLIITDQSPRHCLDFSKSKANSGSVGVISEHSDVNSAVDAFLASYDKSPWKMRKVFVQECVYQEFKDALSWKCTHKKDIPDDDGHVLSYRKLSPEVCIYEDKVFLIDFFGTTPQIFHEIGVEAYRTTKELLTLLSKCEPYYLSLWASEVAEANEVAHAVNSQVVWVNSFADFRGPAKVANTLFLPNSNFKHTERISTLKNLSNSWLKLNMAERSKIMCDAIDTYIESTNKNRDFLIEEKNELMNGTNNGFVDVCKDYVCIGIEGPVGIKPLFKEHGSIFDLRVLQSVLLGNAFAVQTNDEMLNIFEKAGVPAINATLERDGCEFVLYANNIKKVILTNFGTIFAN